MAVSKSNIDRDNFAWIDSLAIEYDMTHSQIVKEALDYVLQDPDYVHPVPSLSLQRIWV